MKAILSDIHGNLEALDAVTAQVEGLEAVCLGDIVCYGPDSIECIRRSAEWETVAGSFDLALLSGEWLEWNASARKHMDKAKKKLLAAPDSASLHETLSSYRAGFTSDGICFFHGLPQDVNGFLFPEAIYEGSLLDRIASSDGHAFIGGGSHIPGVFRRLKSGWEFTQPENGIEYELQRDEKTVITIGSVGQPRDEDPRAAYAILHEESIVFHRIEYDVEKTIAKIHNDPDIDDTQGDRLPQGR